MEFTFESVGGVILEVPVRVSVGFMLEGVGEGVCGVYV